VLQEGMKQILKQISHPNNVYNKIINSKKVIISMLGHKVIFCMFTT